MPQLIYVLIAGFSLYVLWNTCRTKWQVVIVIDPGKTTKIVGAPASKVRALEDFFSNNVTLTGRARIYARRMPTGTLKTKFRGELASGTRQRIRNFLIDCL